jgi:hypothetical protein
MSDRSVIAQKASLGILLILTAALLAGCFQIERTVKIRPDGSGTVEETVLLSKELTGMFDKIGEGVASTNTDKTVSRDKTNRLAEEEKTARAKIADMGEGISLVAVTPITRGNFEGYQAVYGFSDINKLKLQSDSTPADQGPGSGKRTLFRFTGGEDKVLVVTSGFTRSKEPSEPSTAQSQPATGQNQQADQEAALEMLKQMFNGMKISQRIVVVDGMIVESNALFRTGSEITMMDIDFDKLLNFKPGELAKLQSAPQGDKQQLLVAMSKIPGFKVDLNDELRVVFRNSGK